MSTFNDTKPKGWFSRRHQTREAHENARARYQAAHGREARKWWAGRRESLRAERSVQEQAALLDARLGHNTGARRERARLAKQVQV